MAWSTGRLLPLAGTGSTGTAEMVELLASIAFFVLSIGGLGLGLLCGRRGITGSCGGLNNIPGMTSDCGGSCRKPCRKRKQDGGSRQITDPGDHR